jgi:NAD(P)-dependent dehydrogenase (short-subunit alcohol dehydrogenase family)
VRVSTGAALVAGGARSVGRSVALRLAGAGSNVAVLDGPGPYTSLGYQPAGADDARAVAGEIEALGRAATAVAADVRDANAVREAVRQAESTVGPITDLVVASGVVSATSLAQMTRAEWDEVVHTNLTGAFNLIQAVVPAMVERGGGHVVVITGEEGRRGFAGLSHVAAASWGLIGLAKTVALETATSGVTVNVVCTAVPSSAPPITPPGGAPAYPQGRSHVEPDEIAAAVEYLLSDAARSWTGAVIDATLGAAARNSA